MRIARIADFAARVRWDEIPGPARARLRLALVDTLACMIGGSLVPAAQIAARAAREQGAVMEACALGIAASALDFDDGHYEAGGIHLGAVVLPALLAGPPGEAGGPDLLAAMAAAYEIAIRAGYLMAPRAPGDRYHTSGAAASIGAAAGAARLAGSGAKGIARALRIASAQAPMATLQLPMVKESIGWGAASAKGAALLAAAGFAASDAATWDTAPLGIAPTPFDGPGGEDEFVRDLGARWRLGDAYVKPYPCCRAIHAAIDAVLDILAERRRAPEEITAVEVWGPAGSEALDFLPPASIEHAQFSFPWVLGCLIARGAVLPKDFAGDALTDPAILAAASRVTLRGDPLLRPVSAAHSYPARVVVTVGGEAHGRLVEHARGSASHPLSASEVAAKFMACAAPVLGSERAGRFLAMLEGPPDAIEPAAITAILVQTMEFTT